MDLGVNPLLNIEFLKQSHVVYCGHIAGRSECITRRLGVVPRVVCLLLSGVGAIGGRWAFHGRGRSWLHYPRKVGMEYP